MNFTSERVVKEGGEWITFHSRGERQFHNSRILKKQLEVLST